MTGRERLLRTLRGEKADRIPISPFLYYNNIYEFFQYRPSVETYFDPPDFDVVEKHNEFSQHFGFDVLNTCAGSWWNAYVMDKSFENWDVDVTWEGTGDDKRRAITIRTPGGELRQTDNFRRSSTYLIVSATDEYMIKTLRDFDIFEKYAPPSDHIMDCSVVERASKTIGDKGLLRPILHGVFNTMNMFRKLDDIMMDPIADEGFYTAMAEYFTQYNLRQVRKVIASGTDLLEIGGNMASGSAVGPRNFEKYVLPYEKRLVDEIHALGAVDIYHNCGDAKSIMHLYNPLGIGAWGYLAAPPFGDVDLDEALRVMRPGMALIGNIDQVEFLRKATPEQVRERVRDLLLKVKPRGNWILSTTDFCFDGTPYENIHAFVEAGMEYGQY